MQGEVGIENENWPLLFDRLGLGLWANRYEDSVEYGTVVVRPDGGFYGLTGAGLGGMKCPVF